MLFLWKQWGIWAIRWWLYWCKHNSHLPWVCRQLKIKITALPASTRTHCVRRKSWLRIRPSCSPLPQVNGFSGAAARDAWEVLMKFYQNSSICCETVSLGKKNYLAKIRDVNFLYLTLAEKKNQNRWFWNKTFHQIHHVLGGYFFIWLVGEYV